MKRFVVIGLGNFGSSIAESLYSKGHEVIAIDMNEQAVDRISQHVTRAAVGDGKARQTLERVGVKGTDAAIVSTGDDITASVLATMALLDVGVHDVYVKVISPDHARVMERLGVTETIFPERDSAVSLSMRISGRALLNYVRLGAGYSIQEMAVPQAWDGKTLRELDLRRLHGLMVVALHDMLTDKMSVAPDPDARLKDSDTILVAGSDEDLATVAETK